MNYSLTSQENGVHQEWVNAVKIDTGFQLLSGEQLFQVNRRLGVGGSDVGAICGVNPYKTAYDVWLEKTGRKLPDDLSDVDRVQFGHLLEDAVAKRYEQKTGDKVQRWNDTRFFKGAPFLAGNVDRIVVGKKKILECKTAGNFAKGWGDEGTDEVPESYLLQCLHYMNIWGYDWSDLAVLTGGQKFTIYKIGNDAELFNSVFEKLYEFWFQYVLKDTPPPPQTLAELDAFYKSDNGHKIVATESVVEACARLAEFKALEKEIKESVKTEQEIIKAYMKDNSILIGPNGDKLHTWKTQTTRLFQAKKFQAANESVYNQYVSPSESRVFR